MSTAADRRYETDDNGDRHLIGNIKHKLNQRTVWITVISQILVVLLAAVIYATLNGLDSPYAFTITMTTIVVTEVIVIAIIHELIMYPLDIISRAISGAIGENTDIYPPNPNSTHGCLAKELGKAVDFAYANNSATAKTSDDSNDKKTMASLTAVSLLRSLPVGIIVLDGNLNIIAFNNNAPITKVGGRTNIQLDFTDSGMTLQEWFAKVNNNAITASHTWSRIQNVPSDSLEPRHVYDVVADYRQSPSNNISLIVVTIDRTADYVESEDNIDFVALAAHELRGPITVIRGYLDMLDEQIYSTASQEQRDLLDRLNVSSRRLTSYINNILNANRYDRRHLKLKLIRTNISDIIGDVQGDLNLRASTVNRHLQWDIPANLPDIAADKSTIGEVITNLVDNAIKYSSSGGSIEITARQTGNFIAVSVTDHGIGIAQSAADHLFTKFYRSHRSSASVGGTGIGLYISRAIVESHGGSIGVDSIEGKGSTFNFTLPTYDSIKNQLAKQHNSNEQLITSAGSQIRNHGIIKK